MSKHNKRKAQDKAPATDELDTPNAQLQESPDGVPNELQQPATEQVAEAIVTEADHAEPVADTLPQSEEQTAPPVEPDAPDTENDISPPAPETAPAQAAAPVIIRQGGNGLSTLALLVALAGAGLAGWNWYQQQQPVAAVPVSDQNAAFEQLEKQLKDQSSRIEQLGKLQDGQNKQVDTLESRLKEAPGQSALDDIQNTLKQVQSAHQNFTLRFESAFGNTRQDWRLAEAEHLLRMASLRLSALQDLQSARHLIEAADQILFEQDDPAAFSARDTLAKALAAIQALPKLDRAGIFMRLGAMQQQSAEIDQMLPGFTPGQSDSDSTVEWRKWLDKASEYVRLDVNSSTEIKPLLSSQELTHIRLALGLALEQAQWGALNGRQDVYTRSIEQATQLLNHYFAKDHQAASAMREQLAELAPAVVSQEMPDINPALVALQAYIQQRTLEQRAPREVNP